MNILLTLAFNGSRYHGFQVQENALSICTVIQDAMENVFGNRPDVKGCSRTDSGVHAREYYLNFHQETNLSNRKLPLALNRFLPPDIRVTSARRVAEKFHARYDAVKKEYQYVFLDSHIDEVFQPGLYYRIPYKLNVSEMNRAAGMLVGQHDFKAFMSSGSKIIDTTRRVFTASVERQQRMVVFSIEADGYLYNMVRIIAGTLLKVGAAKWQAEKVAEILAMENRKNAGDTLPAKGLFLHKVTYETDSLLFENCPYNQEQPAGK